MVDDTIEAFGNVRLVITGGDIVSVGHAKQFVTRYPNVRLINAYGPTENTTFSCYHMVRLAEPPEISLSIGRPISHTRVYLINPQLQPVPIRVPGELCLGGVGLAQGYLNQPALTAEKFIPDPFSTEPGDRLYRTGDWGRYREKGEIEFLYRRDQQVKIRGFRIELGEIESILGRHPTVQNAIVSCWKDTGDNNQLVAYILAATYQTPAPLEIKRYLHTQLPDYMIPKDVIVLQSFPLLSCGKVDRQALPTPASSHTDLETTYTSPHTPLEKLLVDMWQDLIKRNPIGVNDNFFSLGGHSLLAMQVMARLRNILGLDIPLRTLFEYPTIVQLATKIDLQLVDTFPNWPKDEF